MFRTMQDMHFKTMQGMQISRHLGQFIPSCFVHGLLDRISHDRYSHTWRNVSLISNLKKDLINVRDIYPCVGCH